MRARSILTTPVYCFVGVIQKRIDVLCVACAFMMLLIWWWSRDWKELALAFMLIVIAAMKV